MVHSKLFIRLKKIEFWKLKYGQILNEDPLV